MVPIVGVKPSGVLLSPVRSASSKRRSPVPSSKMRRAACYQRLMAPKLKTWAKPWPLSSERAMALRVPDAQ